jgi:hypothetical protein
MTPHQIADSMLMLNDEFPEHSVVRSVNSRRRNLAGLDFEDVVKGITRATGAGAT